MLMIGNDVVQQVLNMRECIEAQESAFKGLLTGGAIFRPRINMYAPCERDDGYLRWGSVEGISHEILAVRLKADVVTWPTSPDGHRTEKKYCVEPGTYCGLILLFSIIVLKVRHDAGATLAAAPAQLGADLLRGVSCCSNEAR